MPAVASASASTSASKPASRKTSKVSSRAESTTTLVVESVVGSTKISSEASAQAAASGSASASTQRPVSTSGSASAQVTSSGSASTQIPASSSASGSTQIPASAQAAASGSVSASTQRPASTSGSASAQASASASTQRPESVQKTGSGSASGSISRNSISKQSVISDSTAAKALIDAAVQAVGSVASSSKPASRKSSKPTSRAESTIGGSTEASGSSSATPLKAAIYLAPQTSQTIKCEPDYLSELEVNILRSERPISVNETEEISVEEFKGIWANKQEALNWTGDLALTQYEINKDTTPDLITKKYEKDLVYVQELAVRYLRPPTLPPPGDILIKQEANTLAKPAPPLIIRQQPPRPCTPEPLVVREKPPKLPSLVGRKVITIGGKRLPPPPRKVIVERLPPVPAKPQAVITERWLPFTKPKRRVIYQKPPADPVYCTPKNVIITWEPPNVTIEKKIKFLGVVTANPDEYIARYGDTLRDAKEFPEISRNIPVQEGHVLAADLSQDEFEAPYELEGDLEALSLIDLEAEGLEMYKPQIKSLASLILNNSNETSTTTTTEETGSASQADAGLGCVSMSTIDRASFILASSDSATESEQFDELATSDQPILTEPHTVSIQAEIKIKEIANN